MLPKRNYEDKEEHLDKQLKYKHQSLVVILPNKKKITVPVVIGDQVKSEQEYLDYIADNYDFEDDDIDLMVDAYSEWRELYENANRNTRLNVTSSHAHLNSLSRVNLASVNNESNFIGKNSYLPIAKQLDIPVADRYGGKKIKKTKKRNTKKRNTRKNKKTKYEEK
jgi:hypothetical protein